MPARTVLNLCTSLLWGFKEFRPISDSRVTIPLRRGKSDPMHENSKKTLRIKERIQSALPDILFPKIAPAEIILFFYILYIHILTYHSAIWVWVMKWVTNIRDGFPASVQSAGGMWGYFVAIFGSLFHCCVVLWMFILILCVALFPLVSAFIMGFSGKSGRDREKDFTAAAMGLFYVITSILTGYMLYLHIAVSRLFVFASPVEAIHYGILWCFFIRQIASGLASLPFLDFDDLWVQEVMVSRVREHKYPWMALVIALAGETAIYIQLRGTYAIASKAVIFAFIDATVLLYLLDFVFSRIPAFSGLKLPCCIKSPGYREKRMEAKTASLRTPRFRRGFSRHPISNAVCPACGSTCWIERSSHLAEGAYVPCPKCRAKLVPLTKPVQTTQPLQ